MSEVTVEHLRERIEDAWLGWEAEGLTHCIATTKESELAAFDAMAEKAESLDKLQRITEKYKAVAVTKNSLNYEDEDGTVEVVHESILEALKAVPE